MGHPAGFEWDEAKRAANLEKHGLDFLDAPDILAGLCLEKLDTRRDYGEERWAALGSLRGRVVYVAYVERGGSLRIISLRKATAQERRAYEQAIQDRPGAR